jgi:hypothetical protein
MSSSLKKLWSEYGIGALIVLLIVAYGVNLLANYLTSKGSSGAEYLTQGQPDAYKNAPQQPPAGVQPSESLGNNEVFSAVTGISTPSQGVATSSNKANIQNPADLLPRDANSQWAQLAPSGQGEVGNINMLRAGFHQGIDTIGQTMRNPNLQIRSEPANPQLYVGPWNLSTIEPDFMRPPLEIGQGTQ